MIKATPAPTQIKVVRRYSNRKLYDAQDSRYVTLAYLASCLRKGQTFEVVNHKDGKDLTKETLASIILEEARAGTAVYSAMELQVLITVASIVPKAPEPTVVG